MFAILFGIFLGLHGMVHLLYAGQSWRLFELQPGMTWPDGSWVLARAAGTDGTRLLASILLAFGALAFIVGGGALALKQNWWRPAALSSVALSTLIYVFLWDGAFRDLPSQGAIGILINVGILAMTLSGAFGL
jgi:hypothetical protein